MAQGDVVIRDERLARLAEMLAGFDEQRKSHGDEGLGTGIEHRLVGTELDLLALESYPEGEWMVTKEIS